MPEVITVFRLALLAAAGMARALARHAFFARHPPPPQPPSSPPSPPIPRSSRRAARGLPLRGIGPALMGGRIADIAVHPHDPTTWYVAVGSGGVWKTTNAGTSWTPVFDDQPSYSIGDVAIGPVRSGHRLGRHRRERERAARRVG